MFSRPALLTIYGLWPHGPTSNYVLSAVGKGITNTHSHPAGICNCETAVCGCKVWEVPCYWQRAVPARLVSRGRQTGPVVEPNEGRQCISLHHPHSSATRWTLCADERQRGNFKNIYISAYLTIKDPVSCFESNPALLQFKTLFTISSRQFCIVKARLATLDGWELQRAVSETWSIWQGSSSIVKVLLNL